MSQSNNHEAEKLTEAQRRVLDHRSERWKIAVPVDRRLVPSDLQTGLNECLVGGVLRWLDRAYLPHLFDTCDLDVYIITESGRRALEESRDG